MAKPLKKIQIKEQMLKILAQYPDGLRSKDLTNMIFEKLPHIVLHTIRARLSVLTDEFPKEFICNKEKSGTFYSLVSSDSVTAESAHKQVARKGTSRNTQETFKENTFYDAFAKFLKIRSPGKKDDSDNIESLNECSVAISCGDRIRLGKWGTPDVIGIFMPKRGAHMEFPHEVVSAEIKTNKNDVFTGFGQACAYRIFSHKVYLVVPKPKSDAAYMDRLEAMCHLMGLGLVVFDPAKEANPSIFEIKLRARKQEPDMFYVNETISGTIADDLYNK